jgi:hypothetical protein
MLRWQVQAVRLPFAEAVCVVVAVVAPHELADGGHVVNV